MPKWFSSKEVEGLDPGFVEKLDTARGLSKTPFYITSGFRTKEQNEAVGGASDSTHLLGLGVDLACEDDRKRFKMVCGLISAGFSRIGVYPKHIHVDSGPEGRYKKDVLWTGDEKT